jgi:hypothetical protein
MARGTGETEPRGNFGVSRWVWVSDAFSTVSHRGWPCNAVSVPTGLSNKDTDVYRTKFPFCQFFDIAGGQLPREPSGFYNFTYSDFCEMPSGLVKMIERFPFAYFMFIPARFIREAFTAMKDIFKRQGMRER